MRKCRVSYDEWKCIIDRDIVGKIIYNSDYEGYIGQLSINKVKKNKFGITIKKMS